MNKADFREWIFSSYSRMHLFYRIRMLREIVAKGTTSDFEYITAEYEKRFHKAINLTDPQTFCEKLQWLKLFYRNDYMPICSDKYRIREYVAARGYEGLCNDLIGVYRDARDIDYDLLPNKFVTKANHGSGWNTICEDKNELQWRSATGVMNDWMRMGLSVFGREWNYSGIDRRIVVEKYIEHKPLFDYKLMCFNGNPKFVQLNSDIDGKHYVDFYDIET